MTKLLYILGNGFDLHYGLKTSTTDFVKILKKQGIYNEIENAVDVFASYGIDWGEYEESISEIDLEELEGRNIIYPDYLSDHEYDRDEGIINIQYYTESLNLSINNALNSMVDEANAQVETINGSEDKLFENAAAIISFNYTSTYEILYGNSVPILHIHGYYIDGEKLIFGYKSVRSKYYRWLGHEDGDFYVNTQRELIWNFYTSWKKELQFEKLMQFLKGISINEIIVLGHSMSPVDSEYMELIEKILQPERWSISYNKDRIDLSTYSFCDKAIQFKW